MVKSRIDMGLMGLALIGISLIATFSGGAVLASDWPYFRGPDRSGILTETGLGEGWAENEPQVLWRASIGWGFSALAVSDDRVFAMGNVDNNDVLYCFDAESGDLIWQQSYAEPRAPRNYEGGPNASPVVHNGRVYTISRTGKIFVRDVRDGSVIWNVDLAREHGVRSPNWGIAGSALILDNMVVFNAGACGFAFDKVSGRLLWENGTGAGGYATPVSFERDGEVFLAMFALRELAILRAETGEVVARLDWRNSSQVNASDPIISGDRIFISTGYNKGGALLRFDGEGLTSIWENTNMRTQMNGCVLWEGGLYGFDDGRELRCLDFETGEIRWRQRGLGRGTFIVAEDRFVILSEDGRLVIAQVSPRQFSRISETRILPEGSRCWTMPVLAGGRVYARNAEGSLVCVDIGGGR